MVRIPGARKGGTLPGTDSSADSGADSGTIEAATSKSVVFRPVSPSPIFRVQSSFFFLFLGFASHRSGFSVVVLWFCFRPFQGAFPVG